MLFVYGFGKLGFLPSPGRNGNSFSQHTQLNKFYCWYTKYNIENKLGRGEKMRTLGETNETGLEINRKSKMSLNRK